MTSPPIEKAEVAATERAIKALRGIGYPCELWTSPSGKRVGIVIDYQAADRLIRAHRPSWKSARLSQSVEGR